MIKVNVDLNKNFKVKTLKLSGHSGYDVIGKDIVCSAVSTAMYVSVGLLEKAGCNFDFKEHPNSVKMQLSINKSDQLTDLVLDNLVETLEGIEIQYPDNLKIVKIGG
ncbi:MAG TPA: ribosomal-processing cysteine protease Prp [Acholeplasmataceae bacterium]|nr:ribosomal-processing cysteine protease Prp [Acholeplasmataceae bacterium]